MWVTALFAPWICFRRFVAERDQTQAVGFTFVVVTVFLSFGAIFNTIEYPVFGGFPAISFLIWIALVALIAAPVAVHLVALVATLVLMAIAPDRGRVSETVQAIAISLAPIVLIAVPLDFIQLLGALYGTLLLVYGFMVVHQTTFIRGLLAGVIPAYLLFGIGFGVNEVVRSYLLEWAII